MLHLEQGEITKASCVEDERKQHDLVLLDYLCLMRMRAMYNT